MYFYMCQYTQNVLYVLYYSIIHNYILAKKLYSILFYADLCFAIFFLNSCFLFVFFALETQGKTLIHSHSISDNTSAILCNPSITMYQWSVQISHSSIRGHQTVPVSSALDQCI